jgi:cytochrome c biogenesis protein CcmG/thiol:disulfide interchange protein DsbE
VKDLNGNPVEIFKDEKKIYLFWATWCGPCHLQMKIIKNSIEAGTITKEQVRAISMAENVQTVREYQNKENWPFEILVDDRTDSWQRLEIQGTPSIMFVENAVVTYFSTGISPLLQLRLKLSY